MTADFLVIGAQKCGTTTLYEDLRQNPRLHLVEKETAALLSRPTAAEYAAVFANAKPRQLRGEVATAYSMLPQHDGVAEHAHRLVPGAKIVYIVRDPIRRVISHHHHDMPLGLGMPLDINDAIRSRPELIDYSSYATQLRPWIDRFGPTEVRVVRFESYIADRRAGSRALFEWFGVAPFDLADSETVHNAHGSKRIATGAAGKVARSHLYRKTVRRVLPTRVRRRLSAPLLTSAPQRPPPPSWESLEILRHRLQPEVDELARMLGEPRGCWDLGTTIKQLSGEAEG